jgi:hypothetical protein
VELGRVETVGYKSADCRTFGAKGREQGLQTGECLGVNLGVKCGHCLG